MVMRDVPDLGHPVRVEARDVEKTHVLRVIVQTLWIIIFTLKISIFWPLLHTFVYYQLHNRYSIKITENLDCLMYYLFLTVYWMSRGLSSLSILVPENSPCIGEKKVNMVTDPDVSP